MVHIFTEGPTDVAFLEKFIAHIGGNADDFEIKDINGWQGIEKLGTQFSRLKSNNEKIILILDADTLSNGGGFEERKKQIENILKEKKVQQYDLFLFPNNKDDGDLETLLEESINLKHKKLLECFENYEKCIRENNPGNLYQTPNRKSKMYAYIHAFKFIKKDWHFDEKEYWNLDSEYLKALKGFLSERLAKKPKK